MEVLDVGGVAELEEVSLERLAGGSAALGADGVLVEAFEAVAAAEAGGVGADRCGGLRIGCKVHGDTAATVGAGEVVGRFVVGPVAGCAAIGGGVAAGLFARLHCH